MHIALERVLGAVSEGKRTLEFFLSQACRSLAIIQRNSIPRDKTAAGAVQEGLRQKNHAEVECRTSGLTSTSFRKLL